MGEGSRTVGFLPLLEPLLEPEPVLKQSTRIPGDGTQHVLARCMVKNYENEIGELLTELADVQTSLLSTLSEKRQSLVARDEAALSALSAREQELVIRLQACHERRQDLLARASSEGLPSDSIQSLSGVLDTPSRHCMQDSIRESAQRTKLLQHQSLANWVLVQRSLLHLSQLIEIIATGGKPKPTYGNGSNRAASGALVDRAA